MIPLKAWGNHQALLRWTTRDEIGSGCSVISTQHQPSQTWQVFKFRCHLFVCFWDPILMPATFFSVKCFFFWQHSLSAKIIALNIYLLRCPVELMVMTPYFRFFFYKSSWHCIHWSKKKVVIESVATKLQGSLRKVYGKSAACIQPVSGCVNDSLKNSMRRRGFWLKIRSNDLDQHGD